MSDPEKSRQYFHQTTGTTTSSNLLEVEVDSKSRYQLQHTLYPQQQHQQKLPVLDNQPTQTSSQVDKKCCPTTTRPDTIQGAALFIEMKRKK